MNISMQIASNSKGFSNPFTLMAALRDQMLKKK